jgi:hypothetical protein
VDENRFWEIVDATLPAAEDRGGQEDLLWQQLVALPPGEVAAFAWWFDRQIDRSDCDNVEVAFALISGVGSDDGYRDFRCWLISRGRAAFVAALGDPDSLSGVLTAEEIAAEEDTHFGDFGYVSWGVYEHLTGDECPDDPAPESPGPAKEKWDTRDIREVRRRMPRLRQMFGVDKD